MDQFTILTPEVLDKIARHCPRALSTYNICLIHADSKGSANFHRSVITDDFSESYTIFRNNLKQLARENLLEWHQIGDYLHVTLAVLDGL